MCKALKLIIITERKKKEKKEFCTGVSPDPELNGLITIVNHAYVRYITEVQLKPTTAGHM
jgi:hypothetical protein